NCVGFGRGTDNRDYVGRVDRLQAILNRIREIRVVQLARRFEEKVKIPDGTRYRQGTIEREKSLHSRTFVAGTTIE
ncbi:hypothetical protein, partial [Bacillus cereus group sp. BC44]|uniref:hypothetical protein n=1 Tax=Bacillus cereus group sp. BC44 TaxID=3445298 RepID=UPI003F6A3531